MFFADDTNVFVVDKKLQAIHEKGNIELENIDNWMIANKLSINHVDMIKKKMRATLGAVMRIRVYLSSKAMLCLYHSLLLSHVRYCTTN